LDEYIFWRIYDDRSCMIIVDGDTGSGKSSLTISLIAHVLDKKFKPKRQCLFNAGSILHVVKTILNDERLAKKWYGRWIMFDEGGQGADRKLAMSGGVQEFGHMLDTFRKYNINMIITCPEKGSLGRDIVFNHAHILIWVSGNCKEGETIFARWRVRARYEDEIQFVNPSCVMFDERGESRMRCNQCYQGRIGKCNPKSSNPQWKRGKQFIVGFCPSHIWNPYEKIKDDYVATMMEEARKRLIRLGDTSGLLINRNLAGDWGDDDDEDDEYIPQGLSPKIPSQYSSYRTKRSPLYGKDAFID
jgi:hypothetical protein